MINIRINRWLRDAIKINRYAYSLLRGKSDQSDIKSYTSKVKLEYHAQYTHVHICIYTYVYVYLRIMYE